MIAVTLQGSIMKSCYFAGPFFPWLMASIPHIIWKCFSYVHTRLLSEFLFTLRLIYVKNILEMGRVYLKIISLMAMLMLPIDVSQILTFKAWGLGRDHGRETHWKEKILFLPPESIRIFSHLQVAMKSWGFIFVIL